MDSLQASQLDFAQTADRIQPAEGALDTRPAAHRIAGMPSGASIDGTTADRAGVLCHLRTHIHVAQAAYELAREMSFFGPRRAAHWAACWRRS